MDQIIYCKYNNTRDRHFQTKTMIHRDGEHMFVTKEAAAPEAIEFIREFPQKLEMTRKIYPELDFLKCEIKQDVVFYEFLKGKSLDCKIRPYISDVKALVGKIKELYSKYYVAAPEVKVNFKNSDKYEEMFGKSDWADDTPSIKPVNLDVIFDNIIQGTDGKITVYDYEWVFDVCVPEDYVLYRILSHIYDKYFEVLSAKIDFEEFIYKFGITEEIRLKFEKMEQNFLKYIYHDGESALVDTEMRMKRRSVSEIAYSEASVKNDFAVLSKEHEKLICEFKKALEVENEQNRVINELKSSTSWKITKPIRSLGTVRNKVKNEGLGSVFKAAGRHITGNVFPSYEMMMPVKDELKKQKKHKFIKEPKISIVTPLFRTPEKYLREMIDSVIEQTYQNWELCLVDFSPEEEKTVDKICIKYAENDKRIKYSRNSDNIGIATNTNKCIEKAGGDYIAILDHDDILHPSALYKAAEAIDRGADFIYSDEVKFKGDLNHLIQPNLKPDFSYTELLMHNFICHFNVYKKTLLDKAGLYREEFSGSQDHDEVLRLTEKAEKIVHIPEILYFWRIHEGSVASGVSAKPYATEAGIGSVEAALMHRGFKVSAESVLNQMPVYRIKADGIKKSPVKVIKWKNFLSKEDIDKEVKTAKEKFILFIYGDAEIISENYEEEMQLYLRIANARCIDAFVETSDGTIFSSGIAAAKNLSPEIIIRGRGHKQPYYGFENNFMYVRPVSAALGVCFMIQKDMWFTDEEILFTPFVRARLLNDEFIRKFDETEGVQKLAAIQWNESDGLPGRDPYFNNEISDKHLE